MRLEILVLLDNSKEFNRSQRLKLSSNSLDISSDVSANPPPSKVSASSGGVILSIVSKGLEDIMSIGSSHINFVNVNNKSPSDKKNLTKKKNLCTCKRTGDKCGRWTVELDFYIL